MTLGIVGCLLSAVIAVTVASTPFTFLVEPRDTTAIKGETATIYCTVSQTGDRFMWVRDTAVISQTLTITNLVDSSRYSVAFDGLAYNLIISNVQPEDAGGYRCVAFADSSVIMSQVAQLEIHAPPAVEYPTLTSTISGIISVDETIEVTCEVEGGHPIPEIELIKGDEVLAVASGSLVYAWVTSEEDDGAVLECRAVHPLWSEARSTFLGPFELVSDPPTIVLAPSAAEVEYRDTTSFVCSASSAPRAVYRWFINGVEQETDPDGSVVIDTSGSASILHVTGSKETAGVIQCLVWAATGQVTAESTLTVTQTEVTDMPSVPTPQPTAPPTEQPTHTSTLVGTVPARETSTRVGTVPVGETSTRVGTVSPRGTKGTHSPSEERETVSDASHSSQPTRLDTSEPSPTDLSEEQPGESRSTYDIIFISSVSGSVALILVIFIAAVGAVCIVNSRRRRRQANLNTDKNGDVYFRSRYVSIVRSWFSPVHRDTQKTLTSFENASPDQSPYNTITKR